MSLIGTLCLVLVDLFVLYQFNSYQEQSYLLDPDLESLITPVVDMFKVHAKRFASGDFGMVSDVRLHFFSMLPYLFVKFRGYKTISGLPQISS